MQLRQYALIVWRWLWLIVLGTALAAGSAYIVSRNTRPVYSATVTLLVNLAPSSMASTDYSSVLTSERLARTYTELLRTPKVLDEVIKELALPMTSGQLVKRMQVQLVRDTQLVNVSVEDTDPALAAALANKIAEVFRDENEERQLSRYTSLKEGLNTQIQQMEHDIAATQAEIDALRSSNSLADQERSAQLQATLTQYRNSTASLLNNLTQVRLAETQAANSVVVAQEAQTPTSPIRPRTMTNTALAAMVGAMLAAGVVFLIEYIDDTLKTPDDVRQVLNMATLGGIARIQGRDYPRKLIAADHPRSPVAEAYRVLRTNLQFSSVDHPVRTLMVTSPNPVEGKSVTAANLAAVMAQSGQRVVLVDADLRRPTQHRIFELNNHQGLTTALVESEAALSDLLQTTRVENLSVVTSGPLPPNPSELLGSRRMEAVIEALQQRAEVVIFDSPPVMAVTDATVLAARVDGTLLVINSGKTRRALAQRSVETLAAVGARVLGVALNRLASRHGGYYYYHYYYSEDGQRRRHSRRGLLTRLFSRNGHATHGTEAAKAPTGEARDSVHKN